MFWMIRDTKGAVWFIVLFFGAGSIGVLLGLTLDDNTPQEADNQPVSALAPPAAKADYEGTVDGTRFAEAPDDPVGVYDGPSLHADLVYRANNGEQFLVWCEMPGERIADSLGYESTTWFRIETPKGLGYIPDTWFGRIGSQFVRCDSPKLAATGSEGA